MAKYTLPEAPLAARVDTGDRLSFTLFLAIAVHALVIFGVGFTLPETQSAPPTLEVTLASHRSERAPEEADFLAQHNQEASGTEQDPRQLTTDHHAEFADTRINEVNPTPEVQAVRPQEQQEQQLLSTRAESARVLPTPDPKPEQAQEAQEGDLQDRPVLSAEIASLQAKLDQQRQEFARRPRIHRLTSVATRESADARYLQEWSAKVEDVGNRNYPQEALVRRLTGDLRLMVALNADGSIHSVEISQSSGERLLDEAALRIVRLAAPFEPFPPELRNQYDRLEIIRTWRFEISGLSTGR